MNTKPDNSQQQALPKDEVQRKKMQIHEQINQLRKMKQIRRHDGYRSIVHQKKENPKSRNYQISVQESTINNPPVQIEKQKSKFQPNIQSKNQEPKFQEYEKLKNFDETTSKPQQILKEQETKQKTDSVILIQTPIKEQSLKRPLEEIVVFSDELKNDTGSIDQQRKMKSHHKSDSQNYSTCIEITSSSDEEEQPKDALTKVKKQKKNQKNQKVNQSQFTSTFSDVLESMKSLFSSFKVKYLILTEQILVRYRKERKRLENQNKEFKISDSKVKLSISHISVAKTIPIHFISEKIMKKDWIVDDVKTIRFWFFRGTPKDFQEALIQTVKNQSPYIESKKLILLKELYEWYTLAHLLSSSTNIVIVVEKITSNVLVKNVYPSRCINCRAPLLEICLCLKYWHQKKPCCQKAFKVAQSHDNLCKFASEYRPVNFRTQLDSNSRRGVVGLVNCQNSCFMNTALQCLASCQPLTEYFLEKQYLKNINHGNHLGTFGEIATRYAQFIKEIHITQKSSLELARLKKSFCRWDNKYINDQQEDSQQFLSQLLDWLKQDLNLNSNRPDYVSDEQDQSLSMEEKAQVSWKRHLSRSNSIIEYLMAGVIRSGIQCTQCLYESHKFETFLTLPLPLTRSQNTPRQTFELKIILVYSNFKKKNQTGIITLDSFKYEDAIRLIKKTFGLSEQSTLIGLSCWSQGSMRIQNPILGSKQIKRAVQNPQVKLIFLEHEKSEVLGQNIEICFIVKIKSKGYQIPCSLKRYLYFTKNQGSTAKSIFKKLLCYFYNVMFKQAKEISQEQYLNKYLNPQNIPIKVQLRKPKIELTVDHQISLMNKAEIFVSIHNQENFSTKHLFKTLHIPQQKTEEDQKLQLQQKSIKMNSMSINQCFEEFERTDVMEKQNSWDCPKCKQKRRAFKKLCIYKAPKILILFFKRFESQNHGQYHTMRKIQTCVEFPHLLDLKNYVQKEELPYTSQKCELKYRLFAVANHINMASGNKQSGHYIAFVNHSNNWFRINDDRISPIGQGEVCTRNAYMLFYSREQAH